MEISVPDGVPRASGEPRVVRFDTDFGSASGCWFGADPVQPGTYSVEFDLAHELLLWGRDLRPSEVHAPSIGDDGDQVVMGGLLELAADGFAYLRLGLSLTMLGRIDAMPAGADRSWVELVVDRLHFTLYPYDN